MQIKAFFFLKREVGVTELPRSLNSSKAIAMAICPIIVQLSNCRSWKIPSENLLLRSTQRAFDSTFELIDRSVNDGGDFCLLWLVILKSVWCTHLSCDTVGRELWLATRSSLLWSETHSYRKAKLCVYFISFYKEMFWRFIPEINQCVNSHFDTGKNWIA